jgi:hypothetical protein
MAIFNRVNGDSIGVRQVDAGRNAANAAVINTGIAAPLTAIKIGSIQSDGGLLTPNLAAELGVPNGSGVSGVVETIIRTVTANASILAYQVDNNGQVSMLVERSSWATDAAIKNALGSGNIGAYGNCYIGAVTTVTTTGGIKLA